MIGVKILKEKINYLFGNRQVYWLQERYQTDDNNVYILCYESFCLLDGGMV